jgi:putative hydrolase of the HAD superfamily
MEKASDTKAVMFDLDDTLVAFDAVTELSWRQVCEGYCRERPSMRKKSHLIYQTIRKMSDWFWSDEIRHRLGRQDLVSARRKIVTSAFCEIGLPAQDATEIADNYSKTRLENMYIFPESEAILSYLRQKGFKLALLTNGDAETQRQKINRFNLVRYFDPILIEGEMGFGKPDHRVYELALDALELEPKHICMVGDNLIWDVIAPQRLGIRGIWLDRKRRGLPPAIHHAPRYVIHELTDLYQIFA